MTQIMVTSSIYLSYNKVSFVIVTFVRLRWREWSLTIFGKVWKGVTRLYSAN